MSREYVYYLHCQLTTHYSLLKPMPAFQDLMPNNHCFGCGPTNDGGLRIKSYWDGPNESLCSFVPQAHQNAGPRHS